MKRETFNKGFAALLNAFSYAVDRTTPEAEEIYWYMLQEVTDEKFTKAVFKCVGECRYFPSVAELLERIFPPYEKPPAYNPWGDPKARPRIVTAMDQLVELKRRLGEENRLEDLGTKLLRDS